MRRSLAAGSVVLLLAAACRGPLPAPAQVGGTAPHLRTTSGAIALANLSAEIESLEAARARGGLLPGRLSALIGLLSLRGQFLGQIRDYERALELARMQVRDQPRDPLAWLDRARAESTFHLFGPALADLDEARGLGLPDADAESTRAAILQAQGQFDEAERLRHHLVRTRGDVTALGGEATLLADRGETEAADRRFAEAPAGYRDVSPFPIAWLDFQRGVMWMRAGNLPKAREFLAAAHARLPQYVAATGHLGEVEAALGHPDAARELLEAAARASDDPDPAGQLARVLAEAGRESEAGAWRGRASARFEELLAAHPDAFADHAAEFWLQAGKDPRRALLLARSNLALRRTPLSLQLLAQAALAAGEAGEACRAVEDALRLGRPLRPLLSLAVEAGGSCGRTLVAD